MRIISLEDGKQVAKETTDPVVKAQIKQDLGLNNVSNIPDLQKEVSIPTQNAINSAMSQIGNGKPLGAYDANTNTPPLTSTTIASISDGDYYEVTNGGIAQFSGYNFDTGTFLNAGDILRKKGTQLYRKPFVISDNSITNKKLEPGLLRNETNMPFTKNRTYLYTNGEYTIDSAYLNTDFIHLQKNDEILFSAFVQSTSYCLLAYFDKNKNYVQSKSIQSANVLVQNYKFVADDECFVIIQNRISAFSGKFASKTNYYINDINTTINMNNDSLEYNIDLSSASLGGRLFSNGALSFDGTQNYKHTDFIHLFVGDSIDIRCNAATGYAVLAYFDANLNYQQAKSVAGKNATIGTTVDYRLVAEEECYVCITSNVTVDTAIINVQKNISKNIEVQSNELVEKLNGAMFSSELLDISLAGNYKENSGVIFADGRVSTDSVYFLTDYIFLPKGSKIETVGWSSSSYAQLSVYNSNKVYNSDKSVAGIGGAKLIEYTATENCFVRIQSRVAQLTYPSTYRITIFENGIIDEQYNTQYYNVEKDVNILLMIGQSNAEGTVSQGTTDNHYDSVQLSNSIKASTTNLSTSTLVPIKSTEIESPILSLNEKFLETFCVAKNIPVPSDYQYQTALMKISEGGITIDTLLLRFYQLYQCLDKMVALIKAQNKNCMISVCSFVQGEADKQATTDTDKDVYKEKVKALFRAVEWYANYKLKQTSRVQFVTYQVSSFETFNNTNKRPMIPIAHFELSQELDNVTLGAVTYQLPYSDRVHTTLIGTRIMGANMGYFAEKKIIEGSSKKHFSIKNSYIEQLGSKYVIYLECDILYKKLIVDTKDYTGVSDIIYSDYTGTNVVPNVGFELKNRTWNYGAPDIWTAHNNEVFPNLTDWDSGITIESVQIVRNTTIKIICSSNPTGKELWYARRGNQQGGYLRTTFFEEMNQKINVNGTLYNLHDYIPTFCFYL